MNRFEDIFRPFLQGNVARELLRAPIQHIDAQRERRQITVELCPEQRIPQKEIHRVEQQIMETANLALFEIMTRYRPELFCCESMEDILHELRKRGYPANGIFEGSQQKLEGDRLTISLQHGGYNLIKESGCDQAIRRAISERYGMAVDVQFDGVLSLEESDPAYKEIIGKPSLTPEMKAALERPSNAPKPSASRGEAGGKAGDKPSKPGRLLFDCEDLPFVPDSGVLILGKPIKEKPVPLKEVTAETGLTTVWGDIVRKESVTSKDGKWEIYSIDITDYTSSNTLKIIQSSSKKEAIEELKEGLAERNLSRVIEDDLAASSDDMSQLLDMVFSPDDNILIGGDEPPTFNTDGEEMLGEALPPRSYQRNREELDALLGSVGALGFGVTSKEDEEASNAEDDEEK